MDLFKKELTTLLACGALALMIFGIDLLTPLGVAGGVPYVLVVLVSSWCLDRRCIFLVATFCTLLTYAGFELSPAGGEFGKVMANRLFAILAIWVAAVLLHQRKGVEKSLEWVNRELEDRMAVRTNELQEKNAQLQLANEQLRKFLEWQRTVKEEIQEKEIRYRTLFNQSPDAIVLVDPDTTLPVEFNDVAPRLLGYTREEFKRLRIQEHQAVEKEGEFLTHVEKVLQTGMDSFETRLCTKVGDILDIFVDTRIIELSGRKLFHCISRNITEQKRAEATLRAIVEGTASVTSADFFHSLLRHLIVALEAPYAFIAECADSTHPRVRTLAFLNGDTVIKNVEYALEGTPCEEVIAGKVCYHTEDVQRLFPQDTDLVELGVQCYLGFPLRNSKGKVIGHLGLMSQQLITFDTHMKSLLGIFAARAGAELERKQAEESLRENEAWLKTLTEAIPQLVWTAWPDGSREYVNQQAIDYFERSFEELIGWGWTDGTHPDDVTLYLERWAQAQEHGAPFEIEIRLRRASDNAYRWFIGRALPYKDHSGRIVKWFGTCTDITERKQAELLKSEFINRVLSAQEEERARIARELHDETGQALTYLLVGLKTLSNLKSVQQMKERVEELRASTFHTLEEVQRLAVGLHPRILDDLGLRATMEMYCAEYAKKYGVGVELDSRELGVNRLSTKIETSFYRILQEAFTNIAKHASAQKVTVLLRRDGSVIKMIIEDDGCGFTIDHTKGDDIRNRGLGLHGMRERVSLLGGTIRFDSSPGTGTSVSVEIPIEEKAPA